MNRLQLRDAIRLRVGMLSDDQLGTDANLNDLINQALHAIELEAAAGWPWQLYRGTFPTVVGTEEYGFATIDATNTIMRIGSLRLLIDGGYEAELAAMGYSDLVSYFATTQQATPEAYAVVGRTVVLRPIPSAVYTVKFSATKAEPDLSADSGAGGTPILPATFHNAIVEQAAYLWYRRSNNSDQANVAKAELTHILSRMLGYAREQAGPGRIRDTLEIVSSRR